MKPKFADFLAFWKKVEGAPKFRVLHVFGKPAWRVLFRGVDGLPYLAILKGPGKKTVSIPRVWQDDEGWHMGNAGGADKISQHIADLIPIKVGSWYEGLYGGWKEKARQVGYEV